LPLGTATKQKTNKRERERERKRERDKRVVMNCVVVVNGDGSTL